MSYNSFFRKIDQSLSPQKISTPVRCDPITSSSPRGFSVSPQPPQDQTLSDVFGTPIMLGNFETEKVEERNSQTQFNNGNEIFSAFQVQEEGTELFEGASLSTEGFVKDFEALSHKHKLPKIAKNDLLKLFAKALPIPNKLFAKLSMPFLPALTSNVYESGKFVCVDLKTQLEKFLIRNSTYILKSWQDDYPWFTQWDNFKSNEVQLVLNVDGASVFKSSKLSVWPTWVQVFNLPPKLRGAFSNLSLLGLWHGRSKPLFDKLLPLIVFEIESLCEPIILIEGLETISFRIRTIVADMPATASVLCMNQFNGYSSCPHCFIKGFWQNYRMLISVTKPFKLCENKDFKACGRAAERDGDIKCGIKSSTPLNSILDLPWDCPIDPMHQVFLGTGKVLTKVLVSLAKSKLKEANNLMMQVKVPFDILHRIMSLDEIKFWKGFDLKLFFFTWDLLFLEKFPSVGFCIKASACSAQP